MVESRGESTKAAFAMQSLSWKRCLENTRDRREMVKAFEFLRQ